MTLTEQIVAREPMGTDGNSDSPIERVRLRDGRELILKRVSTEWDWMARVARDTGRLRVMWERGMFDRVPADIDHTTVAIEDHDGACHVFMRDVTHALAATGTRPAAEAIEPILSAMHRLHDAFWRETHPELCSLEDRYTMFSPAVMNAERERGLIHGEIISSGWDAFGDLVSTDVAAAIRSLADGPQPLADRLRRFEQTLIHGDVRLGNIGFDGKRMVLIDWGERVGCAPPAVELAWFIGFDGYKPGLTPEQMITMFRDLYGSRCPDEALQLSLVGGLVQLGGIMSYWVTAAPSEEQGTYRDHLSWWSRAVGSALDSCSLI